MTVDVGLSPSSFDVVSHISSANLKKGGKNKMTVTRELSTADDYAADQKQQQKLQKQQQSEVAEEPNGNPDRAMSSAAPSANASSVSSSGSTTSPSTQSATSRPKFMITDILRNDSPASVNLSAHYPSQQQAPLPPQHHPFYQFNLAAAAAAAAAYGFNPAGMMPPLHQLLVGHHQPHHPQMPVMLPTSMAASLNSAESSPRDLSFKRSAAAANFNSDPVDDEDEFVDPDGSDHDRDSPIGKVDLMLSDDESDICKCCVITY